MSQESGCRDCGDKSEARKMSRGEFIGAGTTLAAGAAVVGARAAVAQTTAPDIAQEQVSPCQRPDSSQCGADAQEKWTIEASVLNVLWAEIFPRLVADAWLTGSTGALGPLTFGVPWSPNDTTLLINGNPTPVHGLIPRINRLIARERTDLGLNSNDPPTHFGIRAAEVINYLSRPSGVIPIRLVAEGEFDFILSDDGLDLFAPAKPSKERYLLDFYKFRRTGRGSLGIPHYLDGPNAWAFSIDAPTGAGQVWTNPNLFPSLRVGTSCQAGNLACLVTDDVRGHPGLNPEDPANDPTVLIGEDNLRGFTLEGFACSAEKPRCWQVSGAVYRAILTELPRVIAEIWFERDVGSHTDVGSYHSRFAVGNPGRARSIFKERVETSLPAPEWMVFETRNGLSDVTISNQGILLPAAPNMKLLDEMIDRIAVGAAGNPVFTDSRRPIRGI